MILVFAATLEIAMQEFAQPRGLGQPGREWRYVQGVRDVAGHRDAEVVTVGPNALSTDEKYEAYLRATR